MQYKRNHNVNFFKNHKCLECGEVLSTRYKLINHCKKVHNIDFKDYLIKHYHNNEWPLCLCGCEKKVSWKKDTKKFAEYVHGHNYRWKNLTDEQKQKAKNKSLELWKNEKYRKLRKKKAVEVRTGSSDWGIKKKKIYTDEWKEKIKTGLKNSEKNKNKNCASNKITKKEFDLRIKNVSDRWECFIDYKNYEYVNKTKFKIKCVFCNTFYVKRLIDIENGVKCFHCKKRTGEKEIYDFISKKIKYTISNDRSILKPKEIDVYVPEKNIGVEFHGLAWHSLLTRPDMKEHFNKRKNCERQNIKLLQFFEDEWKEKKYICKSIINNSLGIIGEKVFARKCTLQKIKTKQAKLYLNNWHIDGYVNSEVSFGLFYDNEIVSIISLRKPFHKKYNNLLEISRFASKPNVVVVGGLGKLIKQCKEYVKENNKEGLLTYVDLRIGNGYGYEKVGFVRENEDTLNYWLTDFKKRYNRFKFRANNGKSQKQIEEENKVFKIYGAGVRKFIMKF